jgi:hypothetical protein
MIPDTLQTCPGWQSRTTPADVSGFLSGFAPSLSGLCTNRVRVGVRRPTRTQHTHKGCVCPGSLVAEEA